MRRYKLPINASGGVPGLVVGTQVLDFRRCFLDYRYEQKVKLDNTGTLPAFYGVLDQECEQSPSLTFGSSLPQGMIHPCRSVEVPLFLYARTVGRLQHTARIAIFGRAQPPLEVVLSCIGQGPTVQIQFTHLDFGRIPVLEKVSRTLQLLNQSPIPACFTARMIRGKSVWRVEPSVGEVPPQGQLMLTLVAYLKDTLPFKGILEVAIKDSQTHTIPLSATGIGTTIVSSKPFGPTIDLGIHFSHEPCHYDFTLTNHGQRLHRMYWATEGYPLSRPRRPLHFTKTPKGDNFSGWTVLPPINTSRKAQVLGRGSQVASTRERPVFSLSPSLVLLRPGCSVDMVMTGSSDSPKVARERLLCYASLGDQDSYEQIMAIDVTCRFVAPVLSISTKQLNFYIETVAGKSLAPMYEKLVLKNVSSLPLDMDLSLVEPFSLCEVQGGPTSTTKAMVLGDGMQAEVWVCFNPAQDRISRVVNESLQVRYRRHPQQDTVELHGEVHFPILHFSSTSVDFGCVPNHENIRKVLTITNCSSLPVSYHWNFLVYQKQCTISESEAPRLAPEKEDEEKDPENEMKEESGSPAFSAPLSLLPEATMPVQRVFDISPLHGQLQPKDKKLVTFTFFNNACINRQVVAQCHVEEGPTYEITLRGEGSATGLNDGGFGMSVAGKS